MPNDYPYQDLCTKSIVGLDPFLKVTAAISIVTLSEFKSQTNFTLMSGAVVFRATLLTY